MHLPVGITGYASCRCTRYETGYKVADELKTVLDVDKFDAVVIATGKNFEDSLSASAVKLPVLLVKSELIDLQKELLSKTVGSQFYIVGGNARISDDSVKEIFNMKQDQTIILK